MNRDLYRLVYYSRSKIRGDANACANAIRDILRASQLNNLRDNITGGLLYNARSFGQVLEGPRRAVEATFDRIRLDPRNSDIALLWFDVVVGRAFESWSMAFAGPGQIDGSYFGGIALERCFDPTKMTGDHIKITADHILRTLIMLTSEKDSRTPAGILA